MLDLGDYPAIARRLAGYDYRLPRALYHATRSENLPSIMSAGLQPAYCGEVHGAMEIRPPVPTVYLSRHPQSNNLHSELFVGGAAVVVLKVRPAVIDWRQAWPDDGLFAAFAQEEIFEDAAEIAETFRVPLAEAEAFLDALTKLENAELAAALQPFARWYLAEHGEISVAHSIAPAYILEARDYSTGALIELSALRQHRRKAAPTTPQPG